MECLTRLIGIFRESVIWHNVISLLLVAVVGLEKAYYTVSEGTIGELEICVSVNSSSVKCPIEFPFAGPFAVKLTAVDGTAGTYVVSQCINEAMYNFILSGSHGL